MFSVRGPLHSSRSKFPPVSEYPYVMARQSDPPGNPVWHFITQEEYDLDPNLRRHSTRRLTSKETPMEFVISAELAENIIRKPTSAPVVNLMSDNRPVWINRPHTPPPGGVPLDAFNHTRLTVLEGIKTLINSCSPSRRVTPYIGTYKAGTKIQITDPAAIVDECMKWINFGCSGVALDSLARLGPEVYDKIRSALPGHAALVGEAFYGYGVDQRLQIMLDRKFARLPEPPFVNRSTLNLSFVWLKKRDPALEARALLRGARLVASPTIA